MFNVSRRAGYPRVSFTIRSLPTPLPLVSHFASGRLFVKVRNDARYDVLKIFQ